MENTKSGDIKDLFIMAHEKADGDGSQMGQLFKVMAQGSDRQINADSSAEGASDSMSEQYAMEAVCGRRQEWTGKGFDELLDLLRQRISNVSN